jgi:hypothetical protein
MKRLLLLVSIVLTCCLFFASCDQLPESFDPILEKFGIKSHEHEHEFVFDSVEEPTCVVDGKTIYKCSCGETKEEIIIAEHDYRVYNVEDPSCTKPGKTSYSCEVCGSRKSETFGAPTGHNLGEFVEQSRLIVCSNPKCSYGVLPEGNGKYKDVIVYKYSQEDLDRFYAIYDELDLIVKSAAKYDENLHKYEEGDPIPESYLVMEQKYEELYEELMYITSQWQIAQLETNVKVNDQTKKDNYTYISETRTEAISKFYSFSQPIYDSEFRDIYYAGMTPAEIKSFIFESNGLADPEYKAAVDDNTAIEQEFYEISDPTANDDVLELYARFVENNKTIASILGYSSYVDYAYKEIYDRDYDHTDAAQIVEYAKTYIAPVFNRLYSLWESGQEDGTITYEIFQACTSGSFFSNYAQNNSLNEYIDTLELDGEKYLSFSDELNNLMGDGNLFRGTYQGAYVTTIRSINLPIAYFGNSFSDYFTVAHEFGHYMNEVYSESNYSQSFDLCEMHSQGNEMLFLAFLNKNPELIGYEQLEFNNLYRLLNAISVVMSTFAVDTFEQAVYTDTYSGTYSEEIMADGKITSDEYDLLYSGIIKDLGCSKYLDPTFWRTGTISSPCYYISYGVSALSVIQLLPMADEDYDAAADAYTKLFTYVDEYDTDYDYMTTEETLLYAGLLSFKDEELYKYISQYILEMFS